MRPTLSTPGWSARTAAFVEAGVLGLAELHVVDSLAALTGERDLEILLGLAFAVGAPTRGRVGVDLVRVRELALAEAAHPEAEAEARVLALPWPADLAAWQARVAGSALVGEGSGAVLHPFVLHRGLLLTRRYHRYQERLRLALERRTARDPAPLGPGALACLQELLPDGPGSEERRRAAEIFLTRALTVITGGPGTGKTSLVKVLLVAAARAAGPAPPRVRLAAPTGKAAVRLRQALGEELPGVHMEPAQRAWLQDLEASTLHRLLGFDPRRPSRFRHDATRPLPADVVVVDEASMVDLALMTKLVEAVREDARLVLLGDPGQLSSVGAGCVLADLTAAAERAAPGAALPACLARLGHAHRFEERSGLGRLARAIASRDPGELDSIVEQLSQGELPGVRLLPPRGEPRGAGLPEQAVELALSGYRPYLEALAAGPAPGEAEPDYLRRVLALAESFRVLGAHRAGPLGVEGLNRSIGRALAPREGVAERMHWPGRPLLITANQPALGRMNGDLGLVLPSGGRLQAIFPATAPGKVERLELARLPPHETAFALTIHKSQGSQFDRLLVVLPRRESPLWTRELVYTAVTRARREVTLVADAALLRAALSRRVERASTLAADLTRPA